MPLATERTHVNTKAVAKVICRPNMTCIVGVRWEGTELEAWIPARHEQHAAKIAEAINDETPMLKRLWGNVFEIMPDDVVGDPNGPGGGEGTAEKS